MFLQKLKVDAGFPSPLGATVFEAGVNFSIYSHHAEKIVLCFFNRFGYETHHIPMNRTEDIWHVFVRDIHAGQLYGYRVYGPYDPQNGHLFNGHKLLLDPAAKQLTGPVLFHETQLPYIVGHKKREFSFSRLDSAPFMPKCIVTDENAYRVFKSTKPFIPYEKTIIYETHVKGFTIKKEDIPRRVRGTFAGLAHPKTVAYLKNLGITSVELLPIAAFNTPEHLLDLRLTNYWGYDPICFMAPQSTYLSTEKLVEIKNMVQAYHEAGIEVLLDVVYNHTGEGGYMGTRAENINPSDSSPNILVSADEGGFPSVIAACNAFEQCFGSVRNMVGAVVLSYDKITDTRSMTLSLYRGLDIVIFDYDDRIGEKVAAAAECFSDLTESQKMRGSINVVAGGGARPDISSVYNPLI